MRISDWSSDVCSSDLPGLAHRRADNRPWHRSCASTRVRSSTAGDPELQRFAGAIARLHEDGQSSSVPRAITDCISTWQHLLEVLHFVCELRGVQEGGRRRWTLAQVRGDDRSEEHPSELQSLMSTSYAVF